MPVSTPPVVTPIEGELPNRGQTETQFDTNQQNLVNYQANFGPEINDLADWMEQTANQTETWANEAEDSAAAAAGSETASDTNADRAEEAAATAQEAAGLPPLDTFGRVLHTEGEDNTKTSAFTAESSRWYMIDSTAGGFEILAPSPAVIGDWFAITYRNTVNLARRCHVDGNGETVMGVDALQLTKGYKTYLFTLTADGWIFS